MDRITSGRNWVGGGKPCNPYPPVDNAAEGLLSGIILHDGINIFMSFLSGGSLLLDFISKDIISLCLCLKMGCNLKLYASPPPWVWRSGIMVHNVIILALVNVYHNYHLPAFKYVAIHTLQIQLHGAMVKKGHVDRELLKFNTPSVLCIAIRARMVGWSDHVGIRNEGSRCKISPCYFHF